MEMLDLIIGLFAFFWLVVACIFLPSPINWLFLAIITLALMIESKLRERE